MGIGEDAVGHGKMRPEWRGQLDWLKIVFCGKGKSSGEER